MSSENRSRLVPSNYDTKHLSYLYNKEVYCLKLACDFSRHQIWQDYSVNIVRSQRTVVHWTLWVVCFVAHTEKISNLKFYRKYHTCFTDSCTFFYINFPLHALPCLTSMAFALTHQSVCIPLGGRKRESGSERASELSTYIVQIWAICFGASSYKWSTRHPPNCIYYQFVMPEGYVLSDT